MLYIIEGPDKCGKSTFISKQGIDSWYEGLDDIRDRLEFASGKVCVHFDANDKDPVESLKYCASLSVVMDVYMDRSWISEVVYGNVYRGGHKFSPTQITEIRALMMSTPHIVYYFDHQIAENDESDIYEQDYDKVLEVKRMYDWVMFDFQDVLNIYRVRVI